MNSAKVMDAYSIIAFLENEPGAERVAELIKQARDRMKDLLLSVVNWGEVYYAVHRSGGPAAAEDALAVLETLPIEIVEADRLQTKAAAKLKAEKKMSYADCFAAALAMLRKAELVTGDREFREVEKEIKILWL